MSEGRLNADVDQYLRAAALNTPPPTIVSDPLVIGATPIEQLLRVLGIAANLGDPADNAKSAEQHAERDHKTTEAAQKFAAQDEAAAAELAAISGDPFVAATAAAGPAAGAAPADQAAAMSQQIPQMAASIAGALAGALGGALQPLAQIPQQAAQGAQQAMQTGMGLLQQAVGSSATPFDDASLAAPLADEFAAGAGDLADLGELGGGGAGDLAAAGGGLGGTAPMSYLGPPPVPSASTAPSSAPITPIAPPSAPTTGPAGTAGMAGMPMVPPGAMAGAAGNEKDAKPDTKRVSVPPVRNGAPVQGRLTIPPTAPTVTKSVDGKPVITRRILAPGGADERPGDTKSDS